MTNPTGPFYVSGTYVRGPRDPGNGEGYKEIAFELLTAEKARMTAENLNKLMAEKPIAQASVGVGDGGGSLFVHGSYEAVKRVQALILENAQLRRERPFNGLSSAEAERLALLAEELGEAVQTVGKVLRHGYESHHPYGYKPGSNRDQLEMELGDVKAAVDMMCEAEDLSGVAMTLHSEGKRERVKQYLHHQPTNQGESE